MEDSIIEKAIRLRDPKVAEKAFHEINARFAVSPSAAQRAGLLLSKAVLLGVLHRFAEARKQLELASQETPNNDPDFQLNLDFITGSLYDEEGFPREAFVQLTAMLS